MFMHEVIIFKINKQCHHEAGNEAGTKQLRQQGDSVCQFGNPWQIYAASSVLQVRDGHLNYSSTFLHASLYPSFVPRPHPAFCHLQ